MTSSAWVLRPNTQQPWNGSIWNVAQGGLLFDYRQQLLSVPVSEPPGSEHPCLNLSSGKFDPEVQVRTLRSDPVRGVRCSKPSRMRNGSYASSTVSGSSPIAASSDD
jgi:hypothetical protein